MHLQSQNIWNVYRQEEQGEHQGTDQGEDQRAGEDRHHPSGYNRRLRAMQSPNVTN